MAVRLILIATFVACASAGYSYEMLQMFQNMQAMQMVQAPPPPQPQPMVGCVGGHCGIPVGADVGEYMQTQRKAQQYESDQMSAKIKAQFDAVMDKVVAKKHRYAMGIMSEFTSMCACLKQGHDINAAMFVPNAEIANMTDIVDMEKEATKKPFDATTMKKAQDRMFAGMLHEMCDALNEYMEFAKLVEDEVDVLENPPTPAPTTP